MCMWSSEGMHGSAGGTGVHGVARGGACGVWPWGLMALTDVALANEANGNVGPPSCFNGSAIIVFF